MSSQFLSCDLSGSDAHGTKHCTGFAKWDTNRDRVWLAAAGRVSKNGRRSRIVNGSISHGETKHPSEPEGMRDEPDDATG